MCNKVWVVEPSVPRTHSCAWKRLSMAVQQERFNLRKRIWVTSLREVQSSTTVIVIAFCISASDLPMVFDKLCSNRFRNVVAVILGCASQDRRLFYSFLFELRQSKSQYVSLSPSQSHTHTSYALLTRIYLARVAMRSSFDCVVASPTDFEALIVI